MKSTRCAARAIPAKCPRCKRSFLGRDAILAPSLDNVSCFYCGPTRPTRLMIHPDHKGFVTAKLARELDKAALLALSSVSLGEGRREGAESPESS